MSKLPIWFLSVAAACLVTGVALGLVMGMAHDFHLAPVHAHLNLLGWASLALMGLTYRAFPELAAPRTMALLQFWLSSASAIAFPVGIWLSIDAGTPGLAIAAGFAWFLGAVLFLVRLVMLGLREPAALPPRVVAVAAE